MPHNDSIQNRFLSTVSFIPFSKIWGSFQIMDFVLIQWSRYKFQNLANCRSRSSSRYLQYQGTVKNKKDSVFLKKIFKSSLTWLFGTNNYVFFFCPFIFLKNNTIIKIESTKHDRQQRLENSLCRSPGRLSSRRVSNNSGCDFSHCMHCYRDQSWTWTTGLRRWPNSLRRSNQKGLQSSISVSS